MTCLKGSPQLSNLVATECLGTSLNAAPIMGITRGIAMFVMCALYGNGHLRRPVRRKEEWSYHANVDPKNYEVDASQLASRRPGKRFLTIIQSHPLIIIVGAS